MRRFLLALCLLLVVVPGAAASAATKAQRAPVQPLMTRQDAVAAFLADGKVAAWVKRYRPQDLATEEFFDPKGLAWQVYVGSQAAGVVADGKVDDDTGTVTEAWTGPQVYWTMARGYDGIFGGKLLESWPVWLGFCLVFLAGLASFRRPLSWRNLDLLVLLSFTASLWFFDRGDIFTSVPLMYPPLLYLLGRCAWIGWRGLSPAASAPVWPVWALAAATLVLVGVRIGLDVGSGNVIDVGYSSVIGAQRIAAGDSPYGHFPVATKQVCGPADSHGNGRGRLQASDRCEVPQPQGDTYGPVVYESYLPGYALFGWSGQWDRLPAARFTSILFDVGSVLLLGLLGWRMAGRRLAVTLAFAWAAYPFTQYTAGSSSNDAVMPAFLVAGLILVAFPFARGASVALSGWSKFASLLLVPLWSSYPDGLTKPRAKALFAVGFLVATAVAFSVLLLDAHPIHAAHVFYDRTIDFQLGRSSPFSLWDWRQFHASGIPNLHPLQVVLEVLVVLAAVGVYFVPRRKTPLQLAALTGFLLLAFELVMTHWHYLYIAWFFPFASVAFLAAPAETEDEVAEQA